MTWYIWIVLLLILIILGYKLFKYLKGLKSFFGKRVNISFSKADQKKIEAEMQQEDAKILEFIQKNPKDRPN